MADSKIARAEVKYIFSKEAETKAIIKVKYEDGSTLNSEGIQSVEEADRFLEDLKDNPIYTPPIDTGDTDTGATTP